MRLFAAADLVISDEWIRTPTGVWAVADVRDVWITRRGQAGRGSRWLTAGLAAGGLTALLGSAGLLGWLARGWPWLLLAPAVLLVAGSVGLLDPLAVYLEKRHHELWISTADATVLVWKANRVEAGKALRQIQRAQERHRESFDA
jgi:hypothetical protein